MKSFLFLLLLSTSFGALAQGPATETGPAPGTKTEQKVIYQYKKYESFDLGNQDLNGDLLSPGDLTVLERERLKINMDLYERRKMQDFKQRDADTIK